MEFTIIMISLLCFFLLLFLIMIASDHFEKIYCIFSAWIKGRNERLLNEQKHRHLMLKLKAKQDHDLVMANKLNDSIQLLTLDPNFGENFDRRLRIALQEKGIDCSLEVSDQDLIEEEIKETVKNNVKIKKTK